MSTEAQLTNPADDERTSHDKIWKTVFQVFLKQLIELLDPKVAAILDLDHPEFLDLAVLIDLPEGERIEPDLVAKARTLDGEEHFILLHVEIEGAFRESIDERTFCYSMGLRLKHKLPVISAVVFLTGGPSGVELRRVSDWVGQIETHRFNYLAFGLSQSLAEDWLGRPQPLAAAMAALMRSKVLDKVQKKIRCLQVISRAELDNARRFLLVNVVQTYVRLDKDEEERFAAETEETAKEVRDMVITWEDALAEKWAEGRAEGKAEGIHETILRLAEHKWPSVPDSFRKRLEAIQDLDRLNQILDQVLNAHSLDDVGLR